MNPIHDKSYVFDNTEVRLTGRVAKKTVELTSKTYIDTLIEIEPVDTSGIKWKRWVKKTDLYEVSVVSSSKELLNE